MIYFSTLFISLFVTISLIPLFREAAVRYGVMDIPNERKVHRLPIPKIGGMAMALGSLVPVLLWTVHDRLTISLLLGSTIIVLEGFLDDIHEFGYRLKFSAQLISAFIAIFLGGIKLSMLGVLIPWIPILPDIVAVPLTVLVIVGVTNAINLSDGLDGLAGGITLLSFLCIGYLAYQTGQSEIIMFAVAVSGSIFGFLAFNTHPASVFMGDAGSQLLGYLAITLSIALTQGSQPLSPILPLILLGFPILDTLTVMCERVARGVSPFKADKNHFHHKLMKIGFMQKEAVLCIYLIQSLLVVCAILYRYNSEWFLIIIYSLFAGTVLSGFHIAGRTGWKIARIDPLDKFISAKFSFFKKNNAIIRVSFRVVEFGLPALLIFTTCMASEIPPYMRLLSILFIFIICLTWLFRKDQLSRVLRVCLYLIIPFLTYLSQNSTLTWMNEPVKDIYGISFLVVFLFIILTVKYTRRKKGFKTTPMDFLILFIALILPSISGGQAFTHQMGLLTVKILIFFFGFEILIGELRDDMTALGVSTLLSMLIITVKWFI